MNDGRAETPKRLWRVEFGFRFYPEEGVEYVIAATAEGAAEKVRTLYDEKAKTDITKIEWLTDRVL